MGKRVVVVGGGVTGVGVARDLAMRGADVTLLERDRLAGGTSGRMHGLLHSGARYALSDPDAAEECLHENAILREIASHCIEDTGGLFVSLPEDDPDYYDSKLAACRELGIPTEELSPEAARELEPALSNDLDRAFRVPDGAIDPFRLVVANAKSAANHGAKIETDTAVTGLLVEDGQVVGVRTEEGRTIRADHVVNAAGPWAGQLLADLAVDVPLAPAQGAMAVTNARPVGTVINRCRPTDEGDILVPHETTAILGTTDRAIDGPDAISETRAEIELLREELAKLVPELADTRLIRTYWGVRPLYDPDDGGESGRDFAVLDHGTRDELPGVTTVVGGKLTTYRLMAEAVSDAVAGTLDIDAPCRTADEPLPGSTGQPDWDAVASRFDLRNSVAYRSATRLGDRTAEVLEDAQPNPVVCECEGVTDAEVRDAIDEVGADLGGVRSRTRATMGPCQGGVCAHRIAGSLAETEGADTAFAELGALVTERDRGQRRLDSPEQHAQIERNRLRRGRLLNLAAGPASAPLSLSDFATGSDTEQPSRSVERGPSSQRPDHDVVVYGSGLAGRMAALTASQAGASVALVAPETLTPDGISGMVDLLGYLPDGTGPLANPLEAIDSLPEGHPLRIAGPDGIRDALDRFDVIAGEAIAGSDTNALVPSPVGTPLPVARYPPSFEPGLLSRREDTLVVSLESVPDLSAEFLGGTLSERVPYDVRGATIELCSTAPDRPVRRLARALDRDERWPGEQSARTALGAALADVHEGEPRIGLPAVLGISETPEIRAHLEAELDVAVFEVPIPAPSAAGIRLADRLDKEVRSHGIEVRGRAGDVTFGGEDRVTTLDVQDGPRYEADQFVLATGGVAAGGLRAEPAGVREVAFDLPVAYQREHVAGLQVDSDWRPLVAHDHVYPNLRAAGSILGGFDPATEHSKAGVAIVTGVRAGLAAAREAIR
ncbi:anaerobic glycerol-3-phosphate dehydrogenase subunit GlpA [Halodesulfurarchaeum sp. HSR-GB]|nr:anaerobic glycerol-3-phosphate dehydrogenase subunit GlpA [Halodesulfurarchaeum sp. HSR-GB]MDR5657401.1 anaerobic glycerol-3-phosphate dehydrogenase subunit GlpA [Halodesulfurarchaeum sp. HSR-GB]